MCSDKARLPAAVAAAGCWTMEGDIEETAHDPTTHTAETDTSRAREHTLEIITQQHSKRQSRGGEHTAVPLCSTVCSPCPAAACRVASMFSAHVLLYVLCLRAHKPNNKQSRYSNATRVTLYNVFVLGVNICIGRCVARRRAF